LWATFPITSIFFILFAFWWPREDMPWGRIAAMSFTTGMLMIIYAACSNDIFTKIHAMAIPA
jgi:hypothetical protein